MSDNTFILKKMSMQFKKAFLNLPDSPVEQFRYADNFLLDIVRDSPFESARVDEVT